MNTLLCSSVKANSFAKAHVSRNTSVACNAQPVRHDMLEGMKQVALIATAAGVLSMVRIYVLFKPSIVQRRGLCREAPWGANVPTPEMLTLLPPYLYMQSSADVAFANAARNTTYEEELMASVKARGGSGLPSLTSSPAVEAPQVEKKKVSAKAPAPQSVAPTPRPSINGKELPADAPTIELPQVAAPAENESFASYTTSSAPSEPKKASESSSSDSQSNNNAVVLGGVVLVAVAGIVIAGGNNGDGDGSSAAAAATPVASPAAGGDDNVAEARAWIAAWKEKHGKA
jgi:hypothetical protein